MPRSTASQRAVATCTREIQIKPDWNNKTTKHEYKIINTSQVLSFCENSKGFVGALCDKDLLLQLLIKSGHNLASLLQTTLSPEQALPVFQRHWTNYVVNREPMALWTTQTGNVGPSEMVHPAFWRDPQTSRDGYSYTKQTHNKLTQTKHTTRPYEMFGTLRRMSYMSIRSFHHWGAVQFQTNDLVGIVTSMQKKTTRLNRIRWFPKF